MKVTLVPSSVGPGAQGPGQFLTSYLINDTLAVDVGCLGLYHAPQEQARIKHVLITHTHSDHIGTLPIFVENAYEGKRDCVTVHGSANVLDCLQRDMFNDRVWPDFIRLSANSERPFLKLATLSAGTPVELEGLRITPVPVNHVVPTQGLVIEDGAATIVIVSDTGPTEAIWTWANRAANLKAVFLEAAFPNAMNSLADTAKHLTPALFGEEIRKLTRPARIIAVHIKPRFADDVVRELAALGRKDVEIGRFDHVYEF